MVFEREQAVAHLLAGRAREKNSSQTSQDAQQPHWESPRTHARPRTPCSLSSASGGDEGRERFGILFYWFLDFGDGDFENRRHAALEIHGHNTQHCQCQCNTTQSTRSFIMTIGDVDNNTY